MKKIILGVVITLGVVGVLWAAFIPITNNKVVIGYNQNYEPTQPIAFSHKMHAGTNQIDCRYCHTSTEVSRHASVPSLNICMNCHIQVRTDSPLIQQLAEAYKTGKSIAWQKVHLLPDHVKFNHSMHIKAGKQCTECHGNVAEMEKIKQVKSLAMGWCVNCHRQPENNAATNCSTCHY